MSVSKKVKHPIKGSVELPWTIEIAVPVQEIKKPEVDVNVDPPLKEDEQVGITFRPVCQCGHVLPKLRMVYETQEYMGVTIPSFMMFDPLRCPGCGKKIGRISYYQQKLIGDNIIIFMEENV